MKGEKMAKKNVFVSFDYDNDRRYKNLLAAWDANPNFDFLFEDKTPGEINSNDISRIKGGLTKKINESTYTLFIVGKHSNQRHDKSNEIGFKNWINFEAYQSIQSGNYLAVVKLDDSCAIPEELKARYWWISGFSERNVIKVLNDSSKK